MVSLLPKPRPRGTSWLAGAIIATAVLGAGSAQAKSYLVKNQQAYQDAVQRLAPGDELVLANGTWRDFEIVFEAHGRPGHAISLRAETPGQVIISGRSNLRIGGDHLAVNGLVFRNGYSPTDEVISFRRDADKLANNTRLSEIVIDDFSKPDRTAEDQWIALSGKNNRIDHSYFAGKTNRGPTLVVHLDTAGSRENAHLIEHNFFGHRPSLGGNGGETIRIGVSDFSRTTSGTTIFRNFFERCDGEVEIISIKSEGNIVAENVFYESRGAVVLRHGGSNQVARNVFFGNGVPDTGGVRIINEKQTVNDNYFEGLRGEKFLSALTIMNGVPNSPINRYHQVRYAAVSSNSFIDFVAIGLAVGSDAERSATPTDSELKHNLFITHSADPVLVFDDISGIRFDKNFSNSPAMAAYGSTINPAIELTRAENGLLYPVDEALAGIGAPRSLDPVKRERVGPTWFEKPSQSPAAKRVKQVGEGAAALQKAVAVSRPGDVLTLAGERYVLHSALAITHALDIQGRPGNGKKTVLIGRGAAIVEIGADGVLTLRDVELVGSPGNVAAIAARGETYRGAYSLRLLDVDVSVEPDLPELPFLAADNATFARSIVFDGVSATGWPGPFVPLSGAGKDGWYLADDIEIRNSSFADMKGSLIQFGREGRDESTFGPRVVLENLSLSRVNPGGVAIELDAVDGLAFQQNKIWGSGQIKIKRRVLGLKFAVRDNAFGNTPQPQILDTDGEPLAVGEIGGGE